MYIPKLHAETDLAVLHALMRSHPLATWATQGEGEIIVNHVPFVAGSVPRPVRNSAWGTWRAPIRCGSVFSKTVPSVIVFHGPDSYISPSWYPSKQAHGKARAHLELRRGSRARHPVIIQDPAWLLDHVTRLTNLP